MVTTINFSTSELRELAEMASLAGIVSAFNQETRMTKRLEDWNALIVKIMAHAAKDPKLSGSLERQEDLFGAYAFNKQYNETSFYQECLEELRDDLFWSELIERMADQSIIEHIGMDKYQKMTEDDRREMAEPLENALWQECSKHGIAKLVFVHPPTLA